VFDGGSMVVDSAGDVAAELPRFVEAVEVVDVPVGAAPTIMVEGTVVEVPVAAGDRPVLGAPLLAEPLDRLAEVWGALVLGVHDSVGKNGFKDVVLGLSGGIDSAICAALAVDALGEERLRDLNDAINKLSRERGHWERQVRALGGPDHSAASARLFEGEGVEPLGVDGEEVHVRHVEPRQQAVHSASNFIRLAPVAR
jgi:hypothetical protein